MPGFGKDGKGQILYDTSLSSVDLTAITTRDVVELGGAYHEALEEDFRMLRCDYWIGINPAQAIVILDGPLMVGLAAANLTAAQIEEAIEAIPVNRGDTALEASMRPVWPLEVFNLWDVDSGPIDTTRKGTFNPKWTFQNPDGWTWWTYNMSDATMVTGSDISIFAKYFGVWVS